MMPNIIEYPDIAYGDDPRILRSDANWTFETLLEWHLRAIRINGMAEFLSLGLGTKFVPDTDRCWGCFALMDRIDLMHAKQHSNRAPSCDECACGNGPPSMWLVERVWSYLCKRGFGIEVDGTDDKDEEHHDYTREDLTDLITYTHQFSEAGVPAA